MARRASGQLTDGELEILNVLWEIEPSGLGQIHAGLQARRPVAMTTVATMLKMMLEKKLVRRDDGPRGYLWRSAVSRRSAVSGMVGKLMQHVFDGSAKRLVAHLIEEGELSEAERLEIVELLKRRSSKKPLAGDEEGRP
jgi:predicted transcriptional regulator